MANGNITKSVAVGGATGVVGGPIGVAAGAAAGYLASSGIFGGKPKKVTPPKPFYESATFWEITGGVVFITVTVFLIRHKQR